MGQPCPTGPVVRPSDTRPNKLIWLAVLGGLSLMAGTLLLGIGLL